ncbi:MAG: PKD domain-containing protein [Phycisphaerae bacterium]
MQRRTTISRMIAVVISLLLPIGLSGCPETPGGGAGIPFNLPPTPVITSDVIRGVAPLTVRFSSDRSTDDGLIVSRRWDFGDGNTSQEISPRHTFATTGDFTVSLTLTDDFDAEAARSVVIAVTEAPVAVIAVDPASAESAPAVINFDGSASFDPDGEIVEYQWDFGDGSREFLQVLTHVYASPGTFRARLTVTDDKGVTGTSEKLIAVGIPTPSIEIRVPPPDVSNIVVSVDSPLWVQAVFDVEPGTPHFARAGIDHDRDQCEAQSVLYHIGNGASVEVFTGHDERVNDVAFAPNGNTVATASDDGTVRRYNTATGELNRAYTGEGRINAVAFSPDGLQLVWGQSDGEVVLAEVASGAVIRTFSGHNATVNDVAFSPDGTQILSGSNDRRALLWKVADGTILRDLQHTLGINAVAFSPVDPTMVATGSEDGVIKIWNTTSGAELLTLSGHGGPVNDLVFSSDGQALISASDDNTARAWSPFLGTLVTTYSGHDDDVVSVAISPDGTNVVTGSADGTARVWNSATAETLETVQPCESSISAVEVSPDGTYFLAGVAAGNDIQLDTDPPNGNDLNITYPQGLTLANVLSLNGEDAPTGRYYLWAEIDTDQTEVPVRTYANASINVIDPFTDTISSDTPVVPLVNNQASVVVPFDPDGRHIFDLGPLDRGDRVFLSLLSTPGFGEFFIPTDEFSLMVLDANQKIFAWYQALRTLEFFSLAPELEEFVLFTRDTKLVVGHNSLHYYVVADGGVGVNVRVQRGAGLFEPRQQRVLVNFDGGGAVTAGGLPPRSIPALDAADFDPSWGDDETTTIKAVIMARLEDIYAAYDIQFFSSDDTVSPALPFQTVYVGGSTPEGLLGIADYIDPRNETTTGTAIVYATEIAELGLGGFFTNPVVTDIDVGGAIGAVAAHEIGHLLGLRHTDDATDIMQGAFGQEVGDPTIPRTLKTSLVTAFEQVGSLPAIGFQDAPLLLLETVGPAP